MTELLIGSLHGSILGRSVFDPMPDQSDQHWRQQHQYYHGTPMLPEWQQSQAEHVSGAQSFFAQDAQSYQPYSGGGHSSIPPAFHHDSWASDMDMGTPSTAAFPDASDTYQQTHQPFGHLKIPANNAAAAAAHSPQSSHSGISPQISSARLEPERPPYGRSHTDPMQKRRATAPASAGIKQASSDEEDDDAFAPAAEEATKGASGGGGKGRKRQRIPHTAVERRYRENLNAHLDKLRQTVPALASRKVPGKEGEGGVKPSKCEILSGAIDYIGALERENAALKNEVRALRQQQQGPGGEYDGGWYRR